MNSLPFGQFSGWFGQPGSGFQGGHFCSDLSGEPRAPRASYNRCVPRRARPSCPWAWESSEITSGHLRHPQGGDLWCKEVWGGAGARCLAGRWCCRGSGWVETQSSDVRRGWGGRVARLRLGQEGPKPRKARREQGCAKPVGLQGLEVGFAAGPGFG